MSLLSKKRTKYDKPVAKALPLTEKVAGGYTADVYRFSVPQLQFVGLLLGQQGRHLARGLCLTYTRMFRGCICPCRAQVPAETRHLTESFRGIIINCFRRRHPEPHVLRMESCSNCILTMTNGYEMVHLTWSAPHLLDYKTGLAIARGQLNAFNDAAK